MAKSKFINARISQELDTRITRAAAKTGLPKAVVMELLLEAYARYVEENDEISLPLHLTHKKPTQKRDTEG